MNRRLNLIPQYAFGDFCGKWPLPFSWIIGRQWSVLDIYHAHKIKF